MSDGGVLATLESWQLNPILFLRLEHMLVLRDRYIILSFLFGQTCVFCGAIR